MGISNKPSLYGLIGYPVSHSHSPFMHNAAFKKLKINAAYLLFPIAPSEFRSGLKDVLGLGVKGLNVTIPYKEKVIGYLDKISNEAKTIGAVNTVVVRGKKLLGYNTDGKGFIKALKLNTGKSPKGKKIFMFGAGGAAKAVGFEIALGGAASIVICDVLESKAKSLASRINRHTKCKTKVISPKDKKVLAAEISSSGILINATPCGMKKNDPPIIDAKLLHKNLVVCDLIYNPTETTLIKAARKRGLIAMNGLSMLLHQGALSFELWTGRKAPVSIMKKALEERINA